MKMSDEAQNPKNSNKPLVFDEIGNKPRDKITKTKTETHKFSLSAINVWFLMHRHSNHWKTWVLIANTTIEAWKTKDTVI